jgi:hypothetical protein
MPGAILLVVPTRPDGVPRFSLAEAFLRTVVQVCRKNTCLPPVYSPNELLIKLKNQSFSG